MVWDRVLDWELLFSLSWLPTEFQEKSILKSLGAHWSENERLANWPNLWLLNLAPGANFQQVLQEASMRIRAKYDFYEMTLQVEEFHEDMEDCTQCQEPE